jgi:hypothetical protein
MISNEVRAPNRRGAAAVVSVSVISLFDGPASKLFDGSLVRGLRPHRAQARRRAHGRQGRCAPLTRWPEDGP